MSDSVLEEQQQEQGRSAETWPVAKRLFRLPTVPKREEDVLSPGRLTSHTEDMQCDKRPVFVSEVPLSLSEPRAILVLPRGRVSSVDCLTRYPRPPHLPSSWPPETYQTKREDKKKKVNGAALNG